MIIARYITKLGKKHIHTCKTTHFGLEWISSHQCTSWGWACSARFADEHPPCLRCFFFFTSSSLPHLPPPSYPPSYLPSPTYHLPPPSTYHLRTPPPVTPSPELELWNGSLSCGTVDVELWSYARAVELLLWSRSKSSNAHETHMPTIR
jgi:hypothetical protein